MFSRHQQIEQAGAVRHCIPYTTTRAPPTLLHVAPAAANRHLRRCTRPVKEDLKVPEKTRAREQMTLSIME